MEKKRKKKMRIDPKGDNCYKKIHLKENKVCGDKAKLKFLCPPP